MIPGFIKRFYFDFRWTWTTATAGADAAERWRRPCIHGVDSCYVWPGQFRTGCERRR